MHLSSPTRIEYRVITSITEDAAARARLKFRLRAGSSIPSNHLESLREFHAMERPIAAAVTRKRHAARSIFWRAFGIGPRGRYWLGLPTDESAGTRRLRSPPDRM